MPYVQLITLTIHFFTELCDELGLYVVDEANIETHGMFPMGRLASDPLW